MGASEFITNANRSRVPLEISGVQSGGSLATGPAAVLAKLDKLTSAYARLHHELHRSTERLRTIFEITDCVAPRQNAAEIREAVLARYAAAVGASRVTLHTGVSALRVFDDGAMAELDDARLCMAQSEALEAVRGGLLHGAMAFDQPVDHYRVHVLMGRLPRTGRQRHYDVVVAARPVTRPEFDVDDRLASETILTYGAHLLYNLHLVERESEAALQTVRALATAIDARDAYTHGHSERVGWLARECGQALGMSPAETTRLEWGGLLHDVGKIGVPEALLVKVDPLTPDERNTLQRHAQIGYDVLQPVEALHDIALTVLHHHEDWNGGGYPHGLMGEEIPPGARILRICDTFDAITSQRTYGAARSVQEALEIIRNESGAAFDPEMTPVFVDLLKRCIQEGQTDFTQRFAHVS